MFRTNTADPVVFTLTPPECFMEIRNGYGLTGRMDTCSSILIKENVVNFLKCRLEFYKCRLELLKCRLELLKCRLEL